MCQATSIPLQSYRRHALHAQKAQLSKLTIIYAASQVVKTLVLIDAVCLLTCWPGLLYNFIYRKPSCHLDGKGCLDVIRFVCSRDLMVAEVSDPLVVQSFMLQICYRVAEVGYIPMLS